MNTNTPPQIALARGLETAAIVLVALSVALGAFTQALPPNTIPPQIIAGFVAAATVAAALGNALTAFLNALHNQINTPTPVVTTQLPSSTTAVGTTVPPEAK